MASNPIRGDTFSRYPNYPLPRLAGWLIIDRMSHNEAPINICQYRVKPGHEAEMERLLAAHWPALRDAGLATDEPATVFKGLPSPQPGGPHGADRWYIEMFRWTSPDGPRIAHETPSIMAVWEPMGAICEHLDFPMYQPLDLHG